MKVTDVYPQTDYLKASDLLKPVRVKITEAAVKTFTDQKTQEAQRKIVLSFDRATKVFALNKTQAKATALAVGSEDIADWPGRELVLSAAVASNGQPTINVSPVVTAGATEDNPFTA